MDTLPQEVARPTPPDHPLTLRLLGGAALFWRGQPLALPAPRPLALLAYLALRGPASREELGDLLWPGRGSQHVRQALYTLRALPGAAEWLFAGNVVELRAGSDVGEVRRLLETGGLAEALGRLATAGPLLAGLDLAGAPNFAEWLEEERRALTEAHLWALRTHTGELHARGDREGARQGYERWLALDPLDERAYRGLMRLEREAGDAARALGVFERCRRTLRQELDAAPGEETLALLREIEGRGERRDDRARVLDAPALAALFPEPLRGREDDLARARGELERRGRVLLHGLAGMGKTRLAAALGEACLSPGGRAPGGRALWLEVGDDPPEAALPALLEPLGLRPGQARTAALTSALGQALAGRGVTLAVLDNVWNSYTLHTLLDLLPPALRVIVTSRSVLPGLPRVTLHRLRREASLALLRGHLGEAAPEGPGSYALDALCAVLGDHPYALRLAALTLREGGQDVADLLAVLSRSPLTLGEDRSVRALLDHSVRGLDAAGYEAFLGLGALFAPLATPELLALALRRPPGETEAALYTLLERGLVTRDTRPGSDVTTFRMHELTWHAAREHAALQPRTVVRAACAYAGEQTARPDALAAELPNLLGAARAAQAGGDGAGLVSLMAGLLGGPYLAARGFPTGSLDLLRAGIEAAQGAQDWAAAALLTGKLGDIQQALLADHGAAIASYLKARDLAGRAGLTARQAILTSLAGTLLALNHLPGVDETLAQALHYAERSGEVLCRSRVLEQRGFILAMRRDFEGAHAALTQARELLRPLLEPGHPQLREAQSAYCNVTSNLGQAEQRLGHLDRALTLKWEALEVAVARDEQMRVANARADIGELLGLLDQPEAARNELTQAIELYRQMGASGKEAAARTLLNSLPDAP